MATDERVGVWLSEIGSVLQGTGFVTKHRDFINKNCDTFSEDEENKLEYTNIFEEYVGFVEEAIEKGMKDKSGDFNMEQLMEALPSYVEREGSKGMPANQSELEGPAKTIDMLLGLGEFESLKATMLLAKRDKAEKKDGGNESMFAVSVEDGVVGTDLEGLLAASGPQFTSNEGWNRLCDRNWLVVEKKDCKVEGKDASLMKTTVTVDLPLMQTRSCFQDFSDRRKNWDDRFAGITVHKVRPGNGIDHVVTIKQHTPYMMKMVGVPDQFTLRMIERVDFPFKGDIYFMVVPWDLQKDCVDKSNKWMEAKSGVLRAHPTEANKSLYIGCSTSKMNWIPDWIMTFLMTSMVPKMLLGLVDKFKQHMKSHQPWQDLPLDSEAAAKM